MTSFEGSRRQLPIHKPVCHDRQSLARSFSQPKVQIGPSMKADCYAFPDSGAFIVGLNPYQASAAGPCSGAKST